MKQNYELRWHEKDIESFFFIKSKKFTTVNMFFSFVCGMFFLILFYGILYPFAYSGNDWIDMFFHGGIKARSTIPYFTMFMTFWALSILLIKWQKLHIQRKALQLKLISENVDFILTPISAKEILHDLYLRVDEPRKFLLFERIERALSNLKNLGNVQDVAEGMSVKAENDENYLSSSYTIFKGFLWSIPVLGFIGTVLGLAQSIGGFGNVLSGGASIDVLKNALGGVTAGLGTAFETTLIALVAALVIQLLMSFMQDKEEMFLDECADYCHKNIISKLKMAHFQEL